MSGSLASAKAKRAGINPPPPNVPSRAPQPPPPPAGVRMSVPQVLAMFDARLNKLEAAAKSPISATAAPEFDRSILDDMEAKFIMLVEEITTMKDVIMKLQSFTMDVNKTLFEERIQIMSDMNEPVKSETINDTDEIQIEKVSDSAAI